MPSWRQAFAVIAVVALGADLWFAQSPRIDKMMHAVPNTARDRVLDKLDGIPEKVRIYDRDYLRYRPGIRLGIRDYGGYEGDPLALGRFSLLRDKFLAAPRALGHANIGYLLESKGKKIRKRKPDADRLEKLENGVYRVDKVAPRVFWIDAATAVGDRDEAWKKLLAAEPGRIAVVESADLPAGELPAWTTGTGRNPPVSGRVVASSRNRITVEIAAPDDGVVVIAESYYPDWEARVDGRSAAIVPVNIQFRGLWVSRGEHRIEMIYDSPGYRWLSILSLLSMLAAVAVLVWEWRRGRREFAE